MTRVAPRKSRPEASRVPTSVPTTPPAVWRSTPGAQCKVVSPQLVSSTTTKPAIRTAVFMREPCSPRPRRWSIQPHAPSITGNRNAGRPKMKNRTSASHAPIGPIRLWTTVELPVNEKPGSSGL